MKNYKFFVILLFFLCVGITFYKLTDNGFCCSYKVVYASKYEDEIDFEIKNNNIIENYKINLFNGASSYKKRLLNKQSIVDIVENLKTMGFSDEEISIYLFPEILNIYKNIENKVFKPEKNDEILVLKNECKVKIKKGEKGKYLNKENFYKDFLNQLLIQKKKIIVDVDVISYKKEGLDVNNFQKRAEFVTNFNSSTTERKNNIRVALKSFDGIILNEGESLSFNQTTGQRNKESGYMPAKIISGGTFIDGYGGGVCQVSTTLYNACLLAGLEIVEVHSHSLPVSYIEPSFDAMVNQGSSDLVVRNNTGSKIVITTSSNGDECKVVIFGKENNYKVEKISKKTKIIEASNEELIETDYKKYGIEDLQIGQQKKISYAKDGFYSEGYLNYYDKKGNLIKTQKIRESKYNPTKGITVRKEN